jgi:hypothetical protein
LNLFWKIILEVGIAIALVIVGGGFWNCIKSKAHSVRLLRDSNELKRLFEFVGRDKLISDSLNIQPVFGSFAANMVALGSAHLSALNRTRNFMFVAIVALFFLSYLLGLYFFLGNVFGVTA